MTKQTETVQTEQTLDLSSYVFTPVAKTNVKPIAELTPEQKQLVEKAKAEAGKTHKQIVESYAKALADCKNLLDNLANKNLANWAFNLKDLFLEFLAITPVDLKSGKIVITLKPLFNTPSGSFGFYEYGSKDEYQRSENFQLVSKAKTRVEKAFVNLDENFEAIIAGKEFYIDYRADAYKKAIFQYEEDKKAGKELQEPILENFLNLTVVIAPKPAKVK